MLKTVSRDLSLPVEADIKGEKRMCRHNLLARPGSIQLDLNLIIASSGQQMSIQFKFN